MSRVNGRGADQFDCGGLLRSCVSLSGRKAWGSYSATLSAEPRLRLFLLAWAGRAEVGLYQGTKVNRFKNFDIWAGMRKRGSE